MDKRVNMRNILKQTPIPIYWKDAHGRYLGCNQAMLKIINCPNEEDIIGKKDKELFRIYKNQIFYILSKNNRALKKTKISRKTIKLPSDELCEFLHIRTPLLNDSKSIIGIIGVFHNITELGLQPVQEIPTKVNTEDALKQQFTEIIDKLPCHIYWTDKKGALQGCNEQQAKSFGFPYSDKLIGKTIHEVGKRLEWEPGVADTIQSNNNEVIKSGKAKIVEEWATFPGEKKEYFCLIRVRIVMLEEKLSVCSVSP